MAFLDVPADYLAEIERLAGEAHMSASEMLQSLTGSADELRQRKVMPPGVTVATASGYRKIITSHSYEVGG